jgi:hypothetical protein
MSCLQGRRHDFCRKAWATWGRTPRSFIIVLFIQEVKCVKTLLICTRQSQNKLRGKRVCTTLDTEDGNTKKQRDHRIKETVLLLPRPRPHPPTVFPAVKSPDGIPAPSEAAHAQSTTLPPIFNPPCHLSPSHAVLPGKISCTEVGRWGSETSIRCLATQMRASLTVFVLLGSCESLQMQRAMLQVDQ